MGGGGQVHEDSAISGAFIPPGPQFVQPLGHIPVPEVESGHGREVFLGGIEVIEAGRQDPRPVQGPLQ